MEVKKHIIVEGLVQGVSFRYYTEKKACELALKGSVKNLMNGNVEIFVEGDQRIVEEFADWCWQGSPMSQVKKVNIMEISKIEAFTPFKILI